MKVTNIDTLSALLDRLICERIKLFFFEKDGKVEQSDHQRVVIDEIKSKISELFIECFDKNDYEYLEEKRTFDENAIVESLEQLTVNDIRIGEGDRSRLEQITSDHPDFDIIILNEKLTRKSNEGRAKHKNNIDKSFKKMFNA